MPGPCPPPAELASPTVTEPAGVLGHLLPAVWTPCEPPSPAPGREARAPCCHMRPCARPVTGQLAVDSAPSCVTHCSHTPRRCGLGPGASPQHRAGRAGACRSLAGIRLPSGLSHLLVFCALHWILLLNFLCSQEVSKNLTKENKQIRDDMEGIRTEMNKRGRENCSWDVPERTPDARSAVQRDAAAAYAHPQVRLAPPGPASTSRPRRRCWPGPGPFHPATPPWVAVCGAPSAYLGSPKRLSEGCWSLCRGPCSSLTPTCTCAAPRSVSEAGCTRGWSGASWPDDHAQSLFPPSKVPWFEATSRGPTIHRSLVIHRAPTLRPTWWPPWLWEAGRAEVNVRPRPAHGRPRAARKGWPGRTPLCLPTPLCPGRVAVRGTDTVQRGRAPPKDPPAGDASPCGAVPSGSCYQVTFTCRGLNVVPFDLPGCPLPRCLRNRRSLGS